MSTGDSQFNDNESTPVYEMDFWKAIRMSRSRMNVESVKQRISQCKNFLTIQVKVQNSRAIQTTRAEKDPNS